MNNVLTIDDPRGEDYERSKSPWSYNLIKRKAKYRFISKLKLVLLLSGIVILIATYFIIYSLLNPSKSSLVMRRDACYKYTGPYLDRRKSGNLSKLAEILFNDTPPPSPRNKLFQILVWKEGPSLERRHLYHFTKIRHDPFEHCSVNNCNITYDSDDLEFADAVIFSLQKFEGFEYLPGDNTTRSNDQRWIFLTDQSPFNTFRFREKNDWRNYSDVFNWSMSYKMESDIPVPYGRTVPLKKMTTNVNCSVASQEKIEKLIPNFAKKRRDVLVAIKTADCGKQKKRVQYFEELQKYIDVDVYGRCANDTKNLCSSLSADSCPQLDEYLFYLSFENSNCDEYVTEETFLMAYSKGAIPIIMGPTEMNCEILLPPDSYIHTKKFPEPERLAEHLLKLNETWNENFFSLHAWRNCFDVVNEHGYYGAASFHYCRVCEALNYNDEEPKVYGDLSRFLSVEDNCKE